jgi:hypothetical protein
MKTVRSSLCLLFVFGVTQVLQAASISITPSTQSVNLGDQAVVSLDISGLGSGSAPSVGVFDIDLSFDAAVLALSSVTVGDPVLGDQLDVFGLGSILGVTFGTGTVNVFEVSLDLPDDLNLLQADAFTLATFTFNTLAAGSSALGLTLNALGDADGLPLGATLTGGSVDVVGPEPPPPPVTVPEPSAWTTYALLLAGLAGRVILQRRKCLAPLTVSSESRLRL